MRFNIGFPVVRTDERSVGRTYGYMITKIYQMGKLAHFLRNGATFACASRARSSPISSISGFLLTYSRQLAFLYVHLKTMAHFINAIGETSHNGMYIHILVSYD